LEIRSPLNENDLHVLSYLRRNKGESILVALNMARMQRKVAFDLKGSSRFHRHYAAGDVEETDQDGFTVIYLA
jgi:hypothetical protein